MMDFSKQPALSGSLHCKIAEKLATEIKTLNALQRVTTSFYVKNVLQSYQLWPS